MIDHRFHYTKHQINKNFIFLTICNLTENKRIKELVHAFCKAFSSDENVKLLIAGDGPERKKICTIICKQHREK
jgi:glycosyltransferase involved in cell wall biosynthesis